MSLSETIVVGVNKLFKLLGLSPLAALERGLSNDFVSHGESHDFRLKQGRALSSSGNKMDPETSERDLKVLRLGRKRMCGRSALKKHRKNAKLDNESKENQSYGRNLAKRRSQSSLASNKTKVIRTSDRHARHLGVDVPLQLVSPSCNIDASLKEFLNTVEDDFENCARQTNRARVKKLKKCRLVVSNDDMIRAARQNVATTVETNFFNSEYDADTDDEGFLSELNSSVYPLDQKSNAVDCHEKPIEKIVSMKILELIFEVLEKILNYLLAQAERTVSTTDATKLEDLLHQTMEFILCEKTLAKDTVKDIILAEVKGHDGLDITSLLQAVDDVNIFTKIARHWQQKRQRLGPLIRRFQKSSLLRSWSFPQLASPLVFRTNETVLNTGMSSFRVLGSSKGAESLVQAR